MDIYLIRHTEVAVGRSVAYGQSDVELADNYDEQFNRLREHLPADPRAIFSSPLTRCRRLADDLASAGPAPVPAGLATESRPDTARPSLQFDDRLKEFHFGDWEMVPWADISRDTLDPWMADFVNVPTPNGETFQTVFDRVGTFWYEEIIPLADQPSSQPVFVVSHGGVIRALLCLFLDLSLQNAYRINLNYGAVTKLTLSGSSYTIHYINR